MKNLIDPYIKELYKYFDRAYDEGWLLIAIVVLIFGFILLLLFA